MRSLVLIAGLAFAPVAAAQGTHPVHMPQLTVPTVAPALPLGNSEAADDRSGALDARRLQQLRAARISQLLRRYRDVLEADPDGAPIVRGELLALAPTPATLEAAARLGLAVLRERSLAGLDLHIVVLRVSSGTARALHRLQAVDPRGVYDFNHIYTDSGAPGARSRRAVRPDGADDTGGGQGPLVRVGLIDSGVAVGHEVFRGLTVERHGCDGELVPPAAHGTAVASLLVGNAPALHGAAAGAALYAADVFCARPTGGAVDAVAEAFEWLLERHVPVINVSLVGPPNRLLERVVREVVSRGCLVVAAVGNDGPLAPALYPAAWPGVVGVTGVDARLRVLGEAERGSQVRLAAPGSDMAAARVDGGYMLVRGTSFAAPIVAGLLAQSLAAPDAHAAEQALAALERSAQHFGAAGVDRSYGFGLVGAGLRQQPALAAFRTAN
jgi:subtilisin family serine protease